MRPETLIRSRRIHVGRVVSLRVDDVRLPDGRTAQREVVDHPGAAVIVPLTDGGEILMVRQYRYAVGDVLLELPAGTLERGEDPLACARRELAEEVGAEAARWETLAVLYPSPGVLTEVMHLFLARELTEGPPRGAEEEDLTIERLSFAEALERVRRGEIRDAKSVAGLLLAAAWTR
ncbi:MAG TPA: NUDIX hydrolase [bacterium]|nr:NUDIX hydrolase [bacterium]